MAALFGGDGHTWTNETWSLTQNSLTKGVLTVNDGVGDIATLNLLGNYLALGHSATSGSSTLFVLATDSGTGTSVTTTQHVNYNPMRGGPP